MRGSRSVTAGDVLLGGPASFAADDGVATLALTGATVDSLLPRTWLVALDVASAAVAGRTTRPSLAGCRRGDACQCGDASGDGRVTLADAVLVTRSLLVPPTAVLPRPERCNVGGPPSPATQNCSLADVVILRRALLSPPTAVPTQVCAPAVP